MCQWVLVTSVPSATARKLAYWRCFCSSGPSPKSAISTTVLLMAARQGAPECRRRVGTYGILASLRCGGGVRSNNRNRGCRRHRHAAVDPRGVGRVRVSLLAQRSAPHMMRGGKEKTVLEPRTIPTAAGGDVSTAQPSAGRALGEAITALRRGEPVLIRDRQIGALAVAAELVTEENLHRLGSISQGPASVVLTRRRAVALGLAPREERSSALAIPVSYSNCRPLSSAISPIPRHRSEPTHQGWPPSRSLLRARHSPRSPWRSSPRFSPPLSCFASRQPKPRS